MNLLAAAAAAAGGKQPGKNAVVDQQRSAAAWAAPAIGGCQQKGLLDAVTVQHWQQRFHAKYDQTDMSLTEKKQSVISALGFVARCCMAHQQMGTVDPQGEGSGNQKKTGKLHEQMDQAHPLLTHEHRAAALVAEVVGPEGALAAAEIAAAAAAAAVVAEGASADPYPD